jgi:SAM-dependent methyltransferase
MDPRRSAAYYDRLAPEYDHQLSRPGDVWVRGAFQEFVRARLPLGARLLDFGCGTGIDAAWYAAQGHRVLAFDNSEGMIARLRETCAAAIERQQIEPWLGSYESFEAGLGSARSDRGRRGELRGRQSAAGAGPLVCRFGALAGARQRAFSERAQSVEPQRNLEAARLSQGLTLHVRGWSPVPGRRESALPLLAVGDHPCRRGLSTRLAGGSGQPDSLRSRSARLATPRLAGRTPRAADISTGAVVPPRPVHISGAA